MFTHILVPTDGSELATQAAHRAIELARSLKAAVTVVLASPTDRQLAAEGYLIPELTADKREWEEQVTARARRVLDAVVDEAKRCGVACEAAHVFRDLPYAAIIDVATKNGCDLIVMGSHGYGGFKQVMLGSETMRVLSHTKIPLLVIR